MKNIKRGLSIAIVAAMVLGMTACGGSGKTENAGKAAEKMCIRDRIYLA